MRGRVIDPYFQTDRVFRVIENSRVVGEVYTLPLDREAKFIPQRNFMDAETGESLVVPMSGEGQDVGDKAIFKAISGCQKYSLMKAFMIPTGDDPEGDEGVDERNHREPQKTAQSAPTSQPARNTNQPPQPPTGQAERPSGGNNGAIMARVFKLREELKWEWKDLNQFATDALGREIKFLKKDVTAAEDWLKIEQAMVASKQDIDQQYADLPFPI